MDKQVFKNNKNTIENIDLENPHTFDPNVLKSIPINVNNSKVAVDLINTMIFRYDDSSLCLSTEMVEISRVEARVLSLDWRGEWQDLETLTPKGLFIGFLLGLSDLSPPWA